jgi:hypothetical protein
MSVTPVTHMRDGWILWIINAMEKHRVRRLVRVAKIG